MARPAPVTAVRIAQGTDSDPHAYFNSLVARPDFWKAYSFRSQLQLETYKHTNSLPPFVTYHWPDDLHDAAMVSIPSFHPNERTKLAAPIDETQSTLKVTWWTDFYAGRVLLIDDEAMGVGAIDKPNLAVTVNRGSLGTTKTAHAADASIRLNTNSLPNQVRVTLGTETGHTYLFTWDTLWTESYTGSGLSNHKTFQFASAPNDSLWLESQTRYGGYPYGSMPGYDPATDIAALTMRGYAPMGPGTTGPDPLGPRSGSFIVKPNRWVRQWVHLDLRPDPEYDRVSQWAADALTEPMQLLTGIALQGWSIGKFWIEFNTSQDRWVRSMKRDLVAYVRNFAALKDPVNLPLERPN